MPHHETFVQRGQHRIHVREYPGEEPTIVLMHGFPDNLHLYDRLYPHLSPPRRVVALISLDGERPTSPPAIRIPRPIKLVTSMP
jgi:haloalkane dehalogenase